MSKNNLLKKSVKKFIRLEKARIRAEVLDVKKQEEMIGEVYKKILQKAVPAAVVQAQEVKKEAKNGKEGKPKKEKTKSAAKKVKVAAKKNEAK